MLALANYYGATNVSLLQGADRKLTKTLAKQQFQSQLFHRVTLNNLHGWPKAAAFYMERKFSLLYWMNSWLVHHEVYSVNGSLTVAETMPKHISYHGKQ